MNLKNQPPIFVPNQFRAEIEELSKAALMDLVWDYATTSASSSDPSAVIANLRDRIGVIQWHRKSAAEEEKNRDGAWGRSIANGGVLHD